MSNLKRLLENLLTEGYYGKDEFKSLEDTISRWQSKGDKMFDDNVHAFVKLEDILPYKEYERSRERGRNSPEEWDDLVASMKEKGWNPKSPLHMLIGKQGGVKVGEGNHRLAIAKQLGIQEIPVQFHFVWDKVVKDKVPELYRESVGNKKPMNQVWFGGYPGPEVKRVSKDVAGSHKSASCQLVCKPLAKRLSGLNYDVEIHRGTYKGEGHTWLTVEGSIVDPTADQFDDYPNMDEFEYEDHEIETLSESVELKTAKKASTITLPNTGYHLTLYENLPSIKRQGLNSHAKKRSSFSNDFIYLCVKPSQANWLGQHLSLDRRKDWVLLEVHNLIPSLLRPDEDFGETVAESLKYGGTFAYAGDIFPKDIRVYATAKSTKKYRHDEFERLLKESSISNILKESTEIDPEDYRIAHRAPGKEDNSPIYDLKGTYPDDFYTLPTATVARYYGASEKDDASVVELIRRVHNRPNAMIKIYRAVSKAKSIAEKIADLNTQKRYILKTGQIPPAKLLSREQAMAARSAKNSSAYYDFLGREQEALENQLNTAGESEHLVIKTFNAGDWVTIWRPYAVEHGKGNLGGEYKILTKTVPAKTLWTNGDSFYEFGYNP